MTTERLAFYIISFLAVAELGVICYLAKLLAASRVSRDGFDFKQAMSGTQKPLETKPKARAF